MSLIERHRSAILFAVLFGALAALATIDLVEDVRDGISRFHFVVEITMVVLAVSGVALLWARIARAEHRSRTLGRALRTAERDASRWRARTQELLLGLGEAIDQQFEEWKLTPSERQVGLLLLKGLSHKEAAELRGTSERTVRQQALSVYRKADLSGRAELSAFFLEDLLLPPAPGEPASAPLFEATDERRTGGASRGRA